MMKRLLALLAALLMALCLPLAALAEDKFEADGLYSVFNLVAEDFMSDATAAKLLTVKEKDPVETLEGVSVYKSADNHIFFVSEEMIYSYADLTDDSVTKNIGQMVLCMAVPMSLITWEGGFDAAQTDAYDLIEWINDPDVDDGDVYKGTCIDVYCYEESYVKKMLLFVPHGRDITDLEPLVEKMNAAVVDLL